MLSRLLTFVKHLSLLSITLIISVALHAVVLTVRFVDPESFNKVFKDTPLEVVLVNAGSEQRPEKAQALAQQNLAGGGEAEAGRATSPLPPSPQTATGEAQEETVRMLQQMQNEQQQLLSQIKDELSALPPPQPRRQIESEQTRADEERRRRLTELLAEIDKRIRAENARPKKRYLSPATLKSSDAIYYSHFRTIVERAGTEHFPANNGQKLYGDLVMETWLNRKGEVVDAIVTHSSGNKLLDKRARSIVKKAGPFGVVPAEVSQGRDLLLISSRFKFTRDAALEAAPQAATPQPENAP
ncbi:MAG: TonB family protein [Burkholderiales bacterium]|nr:TonB family protein [Burkholderiales bacterium]